MVAVTTLAWCWPQSVLPDEAVELHVSAPGVGGPVEVEVVRDGAAPEVVHRTGAEATDLGLVPGADRDGADWPVSTLVSSARPGMHLVRTRPAGAERWDPPSAWFVVRSPQPPARGILLVVDANTWNAYTAVGGDNLYTGAVELSFQRPLAAGMLAKPSGAGERVVNLGAYLEYTAEHALDPWHAMAGWAGAERRFVRWAEQQGVALAYATDADLAERPEVLDGIGLVLSVGHDEYWTWEMRDAVEAHVAAGGNVAFFSGNTCYWQVRLEDGGRRMVAWKHRWAEDPVQGERTTTLWADPMVGRPETHLTGVTFTRGGYHRVAQAVPGGTGAYEVHRPQHWLLAGTGLQRGDLLGRDGGPVGYECDGCELTLQDGLPVPTGADGCRDGFEVVATAPATPFDAATTPLPLAPGGRYELEFHADRLLDDSSPAAQDRLRNGHAVLGTWSSPAGGTVVTVGCTDWAYALAEDAAVAQVTHNVLDRLAPRA